MKKELSVKTEYAIAKSDSNIKEIIADNLGDDRISSFDLDRVKMPTGGNLSWTIPGLEGDTLQKEIVGVIIFWQEKRTYWEKEMGEGDGGQPDCKSEDTKIGVGNPGGECQECPFSKFGTARKGQGQACKLTRHLFIIRENDILPIVVSLSPASIAPIRKYFLRLSSNGIPHWAVETKLCLEKKTNENKIDYAVVVPSMANRLDEAMIGKVKSFVSEIKPSLQRARVRDEDAE